MAIREAQDTEGTVLLIDSIDDFEAALARDLPVVVPDELVEPLGLSLTPDDPQDVADLLGLPDGWPPPPKPAAD